MNKKETHECLEQKNQCFEIYLYENKFFGGTNYWFIVFDGDDGEGQFEREISYCPYCGKHLGEII